MSKAETTTAPKIALAQPADELEFHWRRAIIAITGIVALIAFFYLEENWRGKRAWEHYKQRVEAGGGKLDWSGYIPAPVPGDQNFFEAPRMSGWFVGRGGTGLSGRLTAGRDAFLQQRDTNPLVELTIVSPNAVIPPEAADVVLQFKHSALSLAPLQEDAGPPEPRSEVIPLIIMDEVPLTDAIKNLARQGGLNYTLDPKINYGRLGPDGLAIPQPMVSFRWTNLTAEAALVAVLKNYNLQLIPEAAPGVAGIIQRNSGDPDVCVAPRASRQIVTLLQNAIASGMNRAGGVDANAASAFTVFVKSPSRIKPARIFVRAEKIPSVEEIAEFFPRQPNLPPGSNWGRVHIEATENRLGSFRMWFSPGPYTAAADYLAWSDELKPEFDDIREALKRPFAQIPGSYQEPFDIPIPNFITVRMVAQTLAQRAQCHLLLDQPDQALRDLSLIRDLCRLLEGRPTGKPMTLVAAMINVAVTGLYVGAVEEGLRLDAWQEPQLAAIQEQLKQIDLPPLVMAAFDFERVAGCHTLESSTPNDFYQRWTGNTPTNLWPKLKDPQYMFLTLAPRGWIYQNMAGIGLRMEKAMAAFDVNNHVVVPHKADSLSRELAALKPYRAFTFLADLMVPNLLRATQVCAKNQTLVNEALVVCALERHRLAHGQYPETLAALSPRLLEKTPPDPIGGQPLKYQCAAHGQFLLYSVGWNEKDDGGIAGRKDANGFDADQGDWVWPYHQKLIK